MIDVQFFGSHNDPARGFIVLCENHAKSCRPRIAAIDRSVGSEEWVGRMG
jgi:hypothetical protein